MLCSEIIKECNHSPVVNITVFLFQLTAFKTAVNELIESKYDIRDQGEILFSSPSQAILDDLLNILLD